MQSVWPFSPGLLQRSEVHFYFSGSVSAEDVIFVSRCVHCGLKPLSERTRVEDQTEDANEQPEFCAAYI